MSSKLLLPSASLALMVAALVRAGDSAVDWSTIGAATGTSTAGKYVLTGTIGQPTTARVYSRDYAIDGGFWSIIAAIQEPGAPLLSVRLTETNTVVVSWPVTHPGYQLTENPDLNTPSWTPVATIPNEVPVGDDRVDLQVIVPKPPGSRFYRLKGP